MADQHCAVQVEEVPASRESESGDSDITAGFFGHFIRCVLDCLEAILRPSVWLSKMPSRLTGMSYGVALAITLLLSTLVIYADGIRGLCFLNWIIILITSDSLRGMAFLNLIVLLFLTFT
jgi:hypothetical protein